MLILQTHRKKCWDHNVKKYIPDETSAGENNRPISAEKSTTPSNQYLRPEKLLMIDMSIKCVSPDHPQLINNNYDLCDADYLHGGYTSRYLHERID